MVAEDDQYVCHDCNSKWPIGPDGVVYISSDFSSRESGKDRDVVLGKEFISKNYNHLFLDRSYWSLLDDFTDKTVLYLGSDYNISIPLAELGSKMVLSIGSNLEKLRISANIAILKNLKNMSFIFCQSSDLPLRYNYINRIIFSLGIEENLFNYIEDKNSNHFHKFANFNGILWIIGKNKLNPFPFNESTSINRVSSIKINKEFLLSVFKNVFLQLSNKKLLTRGGYHQLINRFGFDDLETFFLFYDYSRPLIITSTDSHHIMYNFIRASPSTNIFSSIVKYLDKLNQSGVWSPYFAIKCTRGNNIHNPLKYFIEEKYNNEPDINYIVVNNSLKSITIFFYKGDAPLVISKIGKTYDDTLIFREYKSLKSNEFMLKDSKLIDTLEVPAILESINGVTHLFKNFKCGINAHNYIKKFRFDRLDRTIGFLSSITQWDIDYLNATEDYHIYSPKEKESFFKNHYKNIDPNLARVFTSDDSMFLAPSHGDLVPLNVLIEGPRISGVIDFEYFSCKDFFFKDFLKILLSTSSLFYGCDYRYDREMINRIFFEEDRYSREINRILYKFSDSFQIDGNQIIDYIEYIY